MKSNGLSRVIGWFTGAGAGHLPTLDLPASMSRLNQVAALEVAYGSNSLAVAASRRGLAVGLRLKLDVLVAEQQLFRVRRDLVKARADSILAGLKLNAAVGSLGEADLEGVNALLVTSASTDALAPGASNPSPSTQNLSTPGPVP